MGRPCLELIVICHIEYDVRFYGQDEKFSNAAARAQVF